jgi:hypothetical protein
MMDELWFGNVSGRKRLWFNRGAVMHLLGVLRKITKNHSQDIRHAG